MRLHRLTTTALTVAALTAALTWPADAAGVRGCKLAYAGLETSFAEEYVEIGPVEGLITGAAYLRYDDATPAIDPKVDPANLIISNRTGSINLWVYSESKPDGNGGWWRQFTVLRTQGTKGYAKSSIALEISGNCGPKGGTYQIEGIICTPLLPTKK